MQLASDVWAVCGTEPLKLWSLMLAEVSGGTELNHRPPRWCQRGREVVWKTHHILAVRRTNSLWTSQVFLSFCPQPPVRSDRKAAGDLTWHFPSLRPFGAGKIPVSQALVKQRLWGQDLLRAEYCGHILNCLFSCFSSQFWRQQFALWPRFFDSSKNCWL